MVPNTYNPGSRGLRKEMEKERVKGVKREEK